MHFESYHPIINFLYFGAVIACAIMFNQPVFLMLSWAGAFIYSVKRCGLGMFFFNIGLVPAAGIYALWYSYYHHFGITNLRTNVIGNEITLEALVYGAVRGITVITVIMIFACVFSVVSSDKVVYLFGRISPKLSLFLSILLRSVPRIKERGRRIDISRSGIGKGIRQGNILQRAGHLVSLISIVITWTLEDMVDSSSSMKSRGYSLKGRTAFSIYRFDNRDRLVVIYYFACFTALGAAIALNQTRIYYDPAVVMNRITPVSIAMYVMYTVFLLTPLLLESIADLRGKYINLR